MRVSLPSGTPLASCPGSKKETVVKLVPVILSGGVGSRLWPESRQTHPKPFMTLPDGDSLLRKTYRRATALAKVDTIVTVINRELLFKTEDEYEQAQVAKP